MDNTKDKDTPPLVTLQYMFMFHKVVYIVQIWSKLKTNHKHMQHIIAKCNSVNDDDVCIECE